MAPRHEVNELAINNQPIEPPDVENEKLTAQKFDAALQYLRGEAGEVVQVDEKKLLRKIDLMVMPLMFGAYLRYI